MVRFLVGGEFALPGCELRAISIDRFEGELANRSKIEARLMIYVWGPEWLHPGGRVWTRDERGFWTVVQRDSVLSEGDQTLPPSWRAL